MLKDIVEVRPLSGHRLYLRYEDGVSGEIDLDDMIEFVGVFEALRDPATFAEVRLHAELGTIGWPNGADLDPDVLYAKLTGSTLEDVVEPADANSV